MVSARVMICKTYNIDDVPVLDLRLELLQERLAALIPLVVKTDAASRSQAALLRRECWIELQHIPEFAALERLCGKLVENGSERFRAFLNDGAPGFDEVRRTYVRAYDGIYSTLDYIAELGRRGTAGAGLIMECHRRLVDAEISVRSILMFVEMITAAVYHVHALVAETDAGGEAIGQGIDVSFSSTLDVGLLDDFNANDDEDNVM